jgi:nitroreductase
MDFQTLIQERYSVRAYRPDEVGEDQLQAVLNAARLAPTAHNNQPFQLVVIHTRGREAELARIYHREWFYQAPLLLCICTLKDAAWVRRDGKNFAAVDAAIAFDHLTLAATELGLGTCWVANFVVGAAREVLGLPEEVEPLVFTPLGYPADEPKPKERKPLSELVRYERW